MNFLLHGLGDSVFGADERNPAPLSIEHTSAVYQAWGDTVSRVKGKYKQICGDIITINTELQD